MNTSTATVDRELRWLLELRATNRRGVVPEWATNAAAVRLGCSPGHVRRLVHAARGAPRRPPLWQVTEWMLTLLYAHGGCIAALHEDLVRTRTELVEAGAPVPAELAAVPDSYVTFWRAFDRLPLRYREYARTGARGVRRRLISLRWQAGRRNEIWQGDSCWLDIWIRPRRGRNPRRPWLILFLDDRHRLVTGAMLCLHTPGTEDGAAALARATRIKVGPTGIIYGGRPGRVLVDGGAEFRGALMTMLAVETGIRITPVKRYTPTHKGKVERAFRSFQRWALAGLPGAIDSPRHADGRKIFHADPDDLLDEHQLWAHLCARIDHYNWHRVHRALGRTPGESWAADPNPIQPIPADVLRLAVLRAEVPRVAHGDGVQFNNRTYLAVDGSYDDWIGRKVIVGHLPHDTTFVELFTPASTWICTAYEHGTFTDEEVWALTRRRDAQLEQLESASAIAARLGAARAELLAGDLPPAQRSVVSVALNAADHDTTAALPAVTDDWLAATEAALDDTDDDPS